MLTWSAPDSDTTDLILPELLVGKIKGHSSIKCGLATQPQPIANPGMTD